MGRYGEWAPYVPVAARRARAASYALKLAKQEKRALCPVKIEGRAIAKSFWAKAWCENLEQYSDFENRLPRGRTYARNGSVIDLQIERGKIKALVSGSDIYRVTVDIKTLPVTAWKRICNDCSRSIDSLMDLLRGRFDQGVMQRLTHPEEGLFPQPDEIEMKCTCPDWATLCKHVAAVLYGVAARLDTAPELLFTLRHVDHLDLIHQAVAADNLDAALGAGRDNALAGSDLGEMFGIEIEAGGSDGSNGARRKTAQRKQPVASSSRPQAAPKSRRKSALDSNAALGVVGVSKKAASSKKTGGKPVAATAAEPPGAASRVTRKRAAKSNTDR